MGDIGYPGGAGRGVREPADRQCARRGATRRHRDRHAALGGGPRRLETGVCAGRVRQTGGTPRAGEIDLLVGFAYTEACASQFKLSKQSLVGNWGMVFRHAGARVESLPDLKGKRVALMRSSTHGQALVELAARFDAAFTPVHVDTYPQVMQAVAQRHVDAGAVNRVFAALHAHEPDVVVTAIVFNPVFVHYAAPKAADPAVLAALDHHLAQLKADHHSAYYDSLRRWLEATPSDRYAHWLPWAVAGVAVVLGLVLAIAAFLRRQVQRQMGELQRRAEMLHAEIASAKRRSSI